MMLQIDHRDSHDIDIFVTNPQLLQIITASVAELTYKRGGTKYTGDGYKYLKILYTGIGEIDFIASATLTENYATEKEILGRKIQLETVTEVVTKKVVYRGNNFQYRDFFDFAAACVSNYREKIINSLSEYPEQVNSVLERIDKTQSEFTIEKMDSLIVHSNFESMVPQTLEITKEVLQESLKASK